MKRGAANIIFMLATIVLCGQNYPYRSDVLWTCTPDSRDWLYKINEDAEIEVLVYRYGILQDSIEISYSIGPELMPANIEGSVISNNGVATIFPGTMTEPGFLDCRLSVSFDGTIYKHHIKVGFEPDKLTPYTHHPDDFTAFWEEAKKEAALCPMLVEREYVPKYSNDKIDCYLVKVQAFQKGQYVYGYLTKPKAGGKYPVVFSPPGAGIKPMDPLKDISYAENGFIRFDMEIHGIRPDIDIEVYDEVRRAFGSANNSYLVNGLDNRDNYYMKKVYLSCVRAIEYLDTPEKINTMAYFDVVNFARQIEVPVFMTWGFNDDVCPPTTSYIVYNLLKEPKTAMITPVNEHWISSETRHYIMKWIKAQLR